MFRSRRPRTQAVLILVALLTSLALSACGGSSGSGSKADSSGNVSLRMQLSWLPSSQFAGYLVADAKGYYRDAGLDVKILPGGPNVNDIQQMVSGAADLAVDRTSTLFTSRDKGIPVKAIAEFDQQSGFWLVAKKSSGIEKPADLIGKTIGIFSDNVFEYDAMLHKMGIDPKKDVHTFFQGFTIDPWVNNKYPVAQMTSWDELQSAFEAGIKPNAITTFKPSDYGVGVLHGSLLATESIIKSNPGALTKFVQATIKGWEYAYAHPADAVKIVVAAGQNSDPKHETDELAAMKQLQWGGNSEPAGWGTINMKVYDANAKVVQQFGDVTHTINVGDAVDTSIYSGK